MNKKIEPKTIGILGGMGPKATNYLFQLIIDYTTGENDCDHIPVLIHSNPLIPDRTAAILQGGPSPLPLLIEAAKTLENAGAAFLIMPCVTAHYFFQNITPHINIPFLHLLHETSIHLSKHHPGLQALGLLATSGTIKTRIFDDQMLPKKIIAPDPGHQEKVMDAIYGIDGLKSGQTVKAKKLLLEVTSHLVSKGCDAIIAGCTELPLALQPQELTIPFIEPLKIIARRAIKLAFASNPCEVRQNSQGSETKRT